jgi:hypothetical protein
VPRGAGVRDSLPGVALQRQIIECTDQCYLLKVVVVFVLLCGVLWVLGRWVLIRERCVLSRAGNKSVVEGVGAAKRVRVVADSGRAEQRTRV